MQILIGRDGNTDFIRAEWYTGGQNLVLSLPKSTTLGALMDEMAALKLRQTRNNQRRK